MSPEHLMLCGIFIMICAIWVDLGDGGAFSTGLLFVVAIVEVILSIAMAAAQ